MNLWLTGFCVASLVLPPGAPPQSDAVPGRERAPRASHANGPPSRGALRRGLAVAVAEAEAGHGAPARERVGESEGRSPSGDEDADVTRAIDAAGVRATSGDAMAQFSLGSFLYYGSDQTTAGVDWIRKAANQRFAPAEYHVGQLHDFGFGAAQDDRLALEWYRKAADDGSAPGQRAVGEFYLKGRGVRADPAEAVRWFRRAADGDDLRAQYQLGQMYFDGTGVPRDYASAYVWFALAAAQTPLEDNRKGLLELRNIAAARMEPAAVAAARRRVTAWKPAAVVRR